LRPGQRGFTYLFLLFLIAGAGLLLTIAGQLWSLESQREKEKELLFAGQQIRQAIQSYHQVQPPSGNDGNNASLAMGQYPRKLEELLEDTRFFPPLHHLRRLYIEPFSGSKEWGLIRSGEAIIGVHSQSPLRPLNTITFSAAEEGRKPESYRDWRFIAEPNLAAVEGQRAASGEMPPSPQQTTTTQGKRITLR